MLILIKAIDSKSHISEVIKYKIRKYWILVHFSGPRISEFADIKSANNEVHLYNQSGMTETTPI